MLRAKNFRQQKTEELKILIGAELRKLKILTGLGRGKYCSGGMYGNFNVRKFDISNFVTLIFKDVLVDVFGL